MKDLLLSLSQEKHYLEGILKTLSKKQKNRKNLPQGSLRISTDQGCIRYYIREGNTYRYLPKRNSGLQIAAALAQAEYEDRVIQFLELRISEIDALLSHIKKTDIDDIFLQEHPGRQALIKPVVITDEQAFLAWTTQQYNKKPFPEDLPEIFTNRGERVRSKSEKILADFFSFSGLTYFYEKPLHLPDGGTVFPDFTFFHIRERKEIYYEHFGMMDHPEYAAKAALKINRYIRNGIFPGDRLLMSFETSDSGLSMDVAQKLIEKFLSD